MNTDLLNLANEVYTALRGTPAKFADPMFLARFGEAVLEISAAPDDESRRAAIQAEVLKLEREFGVQP